MGKIIVPALPTAREMERHLQSLVEDEESAFLGGRLTLISHTST
ncbi:hypothetical protein [Variovorax sp. KBS0712]|nr:hypothetical protein [Variovorax sp. KBS0712]